MYIQQSHLLHLFSALFLPSTSRSIFLLQTFNNILIAPSNKPIHIGHSTHIHSHK